VLLSKSFQHLRIHEYLCRGDEINNGIYYSLGQGRRKESGGELEFVAWIIVLVVI
jgi:hypothetical protein